MHLTKGLLTKLDSGKYSLKIGLHVVQPDLDKYPLNVSKILIDTLVGSILSYFTGR